ncbi:14244_t:CDS:1, partial [Racocetra fulgida]
YEKSDSKEFYETLQSQEPNNLTELEIETHFIYLNKTSYNGLNYIN